MKGEGESLKSYKEIQVGMSLDLDPIQLWVLSMSLDLDPIQLWVLSYNEKMRPRYRVGKVISLGVMEWFKYSDVIHIRRLGNVISLSVMEGL